MIVALLDKILDAEAAYTLLRKSYIEVINRKYCIRANISVRGCLEAHNNARASLDIWFGAQNYADGIEAWDFFLDFLADEFFKNRVFHAVKSPVLEVSKHVHRLTPIISQYPNQLLPIIVLGEFFIDVAKRQGVTLNDPFSHKEIDDIKRFCEATLFDPSYFLRNWRIEAGYFIGSELDD